MEKHKQLKVLNISTSLENLASGQERRFIDYSKSDYELNRPIFLSDNVGDIIASIIITDYDLYLLKAQY